MLAIIDYGVGNLFSLQCSLNKIGVENVVTNNIETIKNAERIILPGVGAFGDAVKKLRESGLFDEVIALAKRYPNLKKVELLPFRKMCVTKYRELGIPFPLENTPECSVELLKELNKRLSEAF